MAGLGIAVLGILAFLVYSPALHGPFVFDDLFLPYTNPHAASMPLAAWIGIRPLLGLSFLADFQLWGLDTFPYHVMNVLLHWGSAVLVAFLVRKLLALAGTRGWRAGVLSGFASLVFLLHPLQTEAVAYIASRSEALSVFFLLAAFCTFLYRRSAAITWGRAAWVLGLFACALASKEHAIAFPALLLLTDYYWNPGFNLKGVRENRRIYLALLAIAVAGGAFIWTYVSRDQTIGFRVQGLRWSSYLLTECRAFFSYIRLFLFPSGQNIDHDFPLSSGLLDHGAIFAMLAILLLAAAAFRWRRRIPLASYGFFVFLILLSPTSSFVPIRDVFVERRLYLPFIGLLLILLEPLRRVTWKPAVFSAALAAPCALLFYLTWERAALWNSVTDLWRDSASKSPHKVRVLTGLGNAYMHERRCADAERAYENAANLEPPDFKLYFNWASAYDCLQRPGQAADLLRKATAERPTAQAFALLGYTQAEQRQWNASLASLQQAETLDPAYAPTYAYRGMLYAALGRNDLARSNLAKCLEIDPDNAVARAAWRKTAE